MNLRSTSRSPANNASQKNITSILQPINIPVIPGIPPEDNTAVIIIFAIWLGLNLISYSAGNEIRRGKIAELVTPKLRELKRTVNQTIPACKITRQTIPHINREKTRSLTFLDASMLIEAMTNLKIVLDPQNIVPKMVALLLLETSVRTAQDGIHPAKLCSRPAISKNPRQN